LISARHLHNDLGIRFNCCNSGDSSRSSTGDHHILPAIAHRQLQLVESSEGHIWSKLANLHATNRRPRPPLLLYISYSPSYSNRNSCVTQGETTLGVKKASKLPRLSVVLRKPLEAACTVADVRSSSATGISNYSLQYIYYIFDIDKISPLQTFCDFN
jgi:hypothetical protein